jgi:hypothetical protein
VNDLRRDAHGRCRRKGRSKDLVPRDDVQQRSLEPRSIETAREAKRGRRSVGRVRTSEEPCRFLLRREPKSRLSHGIVSLHVYPAFHAFFGSPSSRFAAVNRCYFRPA